MKTVVYSADFEPITVVDLPCMPEQIARLMGGQIVLPVYEPLDLSTFMEAPQLTAKFRTVVLTMEQMRWRDGSRKWIFVANCDENALLMRPAWLPGQQGAINEYEKDRKLLGQLMLEALRRGLGGAD